MLAIDLAWLFYSSMRKSSLNFNVSEDNLDDGNTF